MPSQIKIHDKIIGEGHPVFIIAEAGVNHNGDIALAKKLVDAAVESGADAVKFQSFQTAKLIRVAAPKARYQDRNIGTKKSQFEMLKELEMSSRQMKDIKNYCRERGVTFLSTPYDFESIRALKKLQVPVFKLASMDVVSHPHIAEVARQGVPVILSTGMATEREVRDATKVFQSVSRIPENLILMHCNTNYPSKPEEQNMRSLQILKKYSPIVGYSDHTKGNEASLAAVALGAKVLERHLTLDKKLTGPDHKASLNPKEFASFVKSIRNIENILGEKLKNPTQGELENIVAMRRSICAHKKIGVGQAVTLAHLAFKRPGDGLHPTLTNIDKIVGKKARVDILPDENITLDKLTQ